MLLHAAGGQGAFWCAENMCVRFRGWLGNEDNSHWTSGCPATLRCYTQWDILQCFSLKTKYSSPARAAGIKGNDLKW